MNLMRDLANTLCMQKCAATLRNLLDSAYILEFIDNSSSKTGRSRSQPSSSSVTWTSLLRTVVGFVRREGEAIAKLDEKVLGSTSAHSSRQNKKKVCVYVCTRVFVDMCICTFTYYNDFWHKNLFGKAVLYWNRCSRFCTCAYIHAKTCTCMHTHLHTHTRMCCLKTPTQCMVPCVYSSGQ